MNRTDIIRYAREVRAYYGTTDALEICHRMGIPVVIKNMFAGMKAYMVRRPEANSFIQLDERYSEASLRILCAHELGHWLLHGEGYNTFAITASNIKTQKEAEADLFALALMAEDDWFRMPIASMSAYMVKSILEANIELRG